jgi:hypothetical protein
MLETKVGTLETQNDFLLTEIDNVKAKDSTLTLREVMHLPELAAVGTLGFAGRIQGR